MAPSRSHKEMAPPVNRAGLSPVTTASLLALLTLCYSGCRHGDLGGEDPAGRYGVPRQHFEYCELEPVQQEVDPTGGLSALTAMIRYWDGEADEAQLAQKYPTKTPEAGYSIRRLRRIAIAEGIMAFALTMKEKPLDQLSEQLTNGRPVIVNIELDPGGYPGLVPPVENAEDAPTRRYVVVFGQSHDQFLVLDTAVGVLRMAKEDFETMWAKGKHAALICSAN